MEIARCWRLMMTYKWMIIVLSISALTTSICLAYMSHEKYESISIILIRPQEKMKFSQNMANKEILNFPVSQIAPFDAPRNTYIEVIKSRSIVEKIVLALELDKDNTIPGDNLYKEVLKHFKEKVKEYINWIVQISKYGRTENVDPFTRVVEKVQKNLSLRAAKDTYTFEIAYISTDPKEAAAIANTATEIFIDYMSDANKKESTGRQLSLAGRLHESEKELAESRQALQQFKKRYKIFSLSEEYSGMLKIINDLQTDVEKSEAKLAGLLYTYTSSHPSVSVVMVQRDRLMQSLAELKKQVDDNPAKEKQLEDLKLRVKASEEAYSFINKAYEDIRIQESTNSSEIKIVSRAVPPTSSAGPIKIYYVLAGLFTALVFAVTLVLFLESQGARIRSIEDVKNALQLPILSTIPVMKPSSLISSTDLRKLPHHHRPKQLTVGAVMLVALLSTDWSWRHPSRPESEHLSVQPPPTTVWWQQAAVSYQHPAGEQFTFPLPNIVHSPAGVPIEVTLDASGDRPNWLQFAPDRLYIYGTAPVTAENRTYHLIFRVQPEHEGESRLPLLLTITGHRDPPLPALSTAAPRSAPPHQSKPLPLVLMSW